MLVVLLSFKLVTYQLSLPIRSECLKRRHGRDTSPMEWSEPFLTCSASSSIDGEGGAEGAGASPPFAQSMTKTKTKKNKRRNGEGKIPRVKKEGT